jgi:hypothetical protein
LRPRTLLALPIAAALVAHSLVFDFVCDDAYISFVYARNLAEHGQLVFNLGDRVEGYTNFLWTVLLAGLLRLGVMPELAARVLGTGFGVATLFVVMRLTRRLRGAPSHWDLLAPALLAASSGYACWCSGGLESQMFTFFVTLALATTRPAASGAALAAAALTRPEGALVTAVVGLYRLRRLRISKDDLVWAGTFLAIWVPYWAWRWHYYGWFFPNTFYVKAGGAPPPGYARAMLGHGLYYVWQWAWQSRALFALPLVVLAVRRRRGFGVLAVGLIVVYLVYTVLVGGDFMGLHRFVLPLFVLVAVLAAIGLESLGAPVLGAGVLAAFAASQVLTTRAALDTVADDGIDRPGYLKMYAEDRGLIGKALAPHLGPDDFSVVGGVGVQPYYARMRAVDVFGLVSDDIAHNEPPTRPRAGHQKWAGPQRVLSYNPPLGPSFIFYCYSLRGRPGGQPDCGEAGWFEQRGYEPVTLFVPGVREGEYYTFLKRKDRPWP